MKQICRINQAIKLFKGDLPKVKHYLLMRGIRITDMYYENDSKHNENCKK